MKLKKGLQIFFIILFASILTGCWDAVEIQKRTLILALALDKPESENKQNRYEMTIQIAEPTAFSEKSNPDTEVVWNLSSVCPSLFECVRDYATEVARPGYYGHLQVILVGEELAKEGIDAPLDLFLRDHEMRRRTKVIIVKGLGKDAINIKHPLLPIPGIYISDLTQEALKKTALIPTSSTVGQFSSAYQSNSDILLPRAQIRENHIDLSGGAIMKGGKLLDFISGEEVKLYRFIKGTFTKGAYLSTSTEEEDNEDTPTTFEVKGLRTMIHPSVEDDTPHFKLEVLIEGHIAEDGINGFINEEKLKKIEKELSIKIKKETMEFIKKMQEDYQSDIFGFGEELRRHEYPYWKKVEKEWDEVFAEAQISIEVTTFIRRYGRIKQ